MKIITQNFKERLKSNLQSLLTHSVEELVDHISNLFASTRIQEKYSSLLLSVDSITKDLILQAIQASLEEIDRSFQDSPLRKKDYVINKKNVPRTLTTLFGDLTFRRTYYQSKHDHSLHFLLDEDLGLVKFDKYDPLVKAMAIDHTFLTNQKLAGELLGKTLSPLSYLYDPASLKTIPRQSIFHWIQKWQVPDVSFPERPTPDTLYLMVDEKFLGCQDLENDIMVKSFVSFEGVQTVSKGRRKLQNRLVFSTYSSNAWTEYVDWLYQIYDAEKLKTIYVLSDGGLWIKSGIQELKMNPQQVIHRLLCEFHFQQAIHRMTTDSLTRSLLSLSFQTDSKEVFHSYIENLIRLFPQKEESILKNESYLFHNYKAIQDMLSFSIGSSMEAHISHCIASFFSSRPKGYSSCNISKYLKLNDLRLNGISLFHLYLKTYRETETIRWNSQTLDFSLWDHSSSNLPILSASSSPALKQQIHQVLTAHSIF